MHQALKSLLPSLRSLPLWSQSLLGNSGHRRVALPASPAPGSIAASIAAPIAASIAASIAALPAADASHGDVPTLAEAPPHGCGWFDSSHELHQGLCVTEHSQPDTVANELGVTAWLDLHLAGWTSPSCVALRH